MALNRVLEGDKLSVQLQKDYEREERGLPAIRDPGLVRQAVAALNSGDNSVSPLQGAFDLRS